MADVLTGIFGGGKSTEQQTTTDPTTAYLNNLKADQLASIFGYGGTAGTPTASFTQPNAAYAPSADVASLFRDARAPVSIAGNTYDPSTYSSGQGNIADIFNNAILTNQQNTASNVATLDADFNNAIGTGTSAVNDYISKIATPQILQSMALQGLEGGGAVPEAIGKATAQVGVPYLQSLQQAYLSNKANLLNTGAQTQAGLSGQYGGAISSFLPTVPGAYATTAPQQLLPYQAAQLQAGTAGSLFNFADYGRNLQEQDLLRRQGLITTGITGIPYTPVTGATQKDSTQPLFNFFGQG